MILEHDIRSLPGDNRSTIYVRCTPEQAERLGRILARIYPTAKPSVLPLLDQQRYTYACRVPDDEQSVRRRWPAIEGQMLLIARREKAVTGSPGDPQTPASELSGLCRAQADSMEARNPAAGMHSGLVLVTSALTRPILAPARRQMPETTPPAQTEDGDPTVRIARLERLYSAGESTALAAGRQLATALREDGQHARAAQLYEDLRRMAPPVEQHDLSLDLAEALLASDGIGAILELITPDDPSPILRGMRGVALAATGRMTEALPALIAAWQDQQGRRPGIALALARAQWQQGAYEDAAAAYNLLLETAHEWLAATDFAAIAELAGIGLLDRELDAIARFCELATLEERQTAGGEALVQRGLELARHSGDPDQLFHAYGHAIDAALQQRAGVRLVELIHNLARDQQEGRLEAVRCFDLLDELLDHMPEYRPEVLRRPLLGSLEALLEQEVETLGTAAEPPSYLRDLVRTLRGLRSRHEALAAYKRAAAKCQAAGDDLDPDHTPPAWLAGRRVALVGGHGRTRDHVHKRLSAWGARVDEVAPPTTGRVRERDVLDRIRASDLVVLIISYMGHDMSTIVGNLQRRGALSGEVIAIDCRGVSGVCREINRWVTEH